MSSKNLPLVIAALLNGWIALQILYLHYQRFYTQSNTAQAEFGLVPQIWLISSPIAICLLAWALIKFWLQAQLSLRLPASAQAEIAPVWVRLTWCFNLIAPLLLNGLLNYLR